MKKRMLHRLSLSVLFVGALFMPPVNARAADPATGDDWRYDASLYLWGAGVSGKTAFDRNLGGSSDIDLGFDTIINNLNMAFMGAFEARKTKWSLLADVIYLNLGANKGAHVPVPLVPGSAPSIKVDADLKLKAWLVNLVGGYNLWQTNQGTLDVLAGARYFDLKLGFGLRVNAGRVFPSANVWDAVVGVKGHLDLNKQWYVPYYLDVGTGQSDFTWQALAGVGYRFHWGDVSLGYRYIDWRFGSDSDIDNFNLSGPMLAATFRF